jgi:hypothetical protein
VFNKLITCLCIVFQPSVSVGNVSQLAIDLLISTLQPKKWAVAWHPVFVPTVGGDPYSSLSNALSTSCEREYTSACTVHSFDHTAQYLCHS